MVEIIASFKPKWSKKISSREKTDEIRKSLPKCGLPFKVFMYETKEGAGAVTGEFVVRAAYQNYKNGICGNSCLTDTEILEYGAGKAFGWHICELINYPIPKLLSDYGLHRAPQSWCYVKIQL